MNRQVKLSHFAFYPADFLASTFDLSNDEVGAYMRLLCVQFDRGAVDIAAVEAIARNDSTPGTTGAVLAAKFEQTDAGYQNPRLEQERAKAERVYLAQVEGGRKGAAVAKRRRKAT